MCLHENAFIATKLPHALVKPESGSSGSSNAESRLQAKLQTAFNTGGRSHVASGYLMDLKHIRALQIELLCVRTCKSAVIDSIAVKEHQVTQLDVE